MSKPIATLENRRRAIAGKTLAFKGTANWDLYADDKGSLWAIPKPDCLSCHVSFFGDRDHIRRLISKGYFNDTPTDAGLALMEGLYTRTMNPGTDRAWHLLGFACQKTTTGRLAA